MMQMSRTQPPPTAPPTISSIGSASVTTREERACQRKRREHRDLLHLGHPGNSLDKFFVINELVASIRSCGQSSSRASAFVSDLSERRVTSPDTQ